MLSGGAQRFVSEGSFHACGIQCGWKQTSRFGSTSKGEIVSPEAFKTPKYQNLHICHFQKWFGFPIFCYFDTFHKEITIDSLIGSPCILLRGWLGVPPDANSAVFLNIVQKGGGGHFHVQKFWSKFCMILKAFWQHKIDIKRLFKGKNVKI